jgi:hypothetical protein
LLRPIAVMGFVPVTMPEVPAKERGRGPLGFFAAAQASVLDGCRFLEHGMNSVMRRCASM